MTDKTDSATDTAADQVQAMDAMYKWTRHVYDLSRKYYLLGRDRLLREMDIRPGDRALEVGCGTARNLIQLAKLRPDNKLFGLDASNEMLVTAEQSVARAGLAGQVSLEQCLAENLDHQRTFGEAEPFEVIFFSYSLSMIPTWEQAIEAALSNLKPGRCFYIVDFWDQHDLPYAFSVVLKKWLELFHVHFRPEMLQYLKKMDDDGRGKLTVHSVYNRYAYIAEFKKPE